MTLRHMRKLYYLFIKAYERPPNSIQEFLSFANLTKHGKNINKTANDTVCSTSNVRN